MKVYSPRSFIGCLVIFLIFPVCLAWLFRYYYLFYRRWVSVHVRMGKESRYQDDLKCTSTKTIHILAEQLDELPTACEAGKEYQPVASPAHEYSFVHNMKTGEFLYIIPFDALGTVSG